MGKYRKLQERRGWAFGLAVAIVKPVLLGTTKQDWTDGAKIPATGGGLLVLNHVSHIDPLTAAHIVWEHGRIPRYLAKAGLFKNRALGRFLRAAGQIPVERSSAGARAFDDAVRAVRAGELVVVYVEGSITKDPAGWPMVGKSGAARIALTTGCPVIPIGQWGAQQLLPAYTAKPKPFPRKTIHMKVGDPVELEDLVGHTDVAAVREATGRIMHRILDLVGEVRGEQPPAELYDPRKHGVSSTGNPNKSTKRQPPKTGPDTEEDHS
ncbi:lysophospholipid acyltransferase family protein [Nocardioides insulae]|uniref:lysophospholipid acyltransferase family protein n=1 Tax=Nocardioides insulae TaxID=394734 RepID=UPI00040EFB02|nr:lysophospholipid acyltransferase family protein [Nocardioides insulae]